MIAAFLLMLLLEEPAAVVQRGVAQYHAGHPAEAAETLGAVLPRLAAESPERREAVQVLGLSLYLAGRIADAVPHLEETRRIAPDNLELAYVLGMAYVQTRQADKAREVWARAFGVEPGSAAARLLNAQMMVRAELDEMAAAELQAALLADPKLPHARLLLGQGALFRGRLDEAVTLLRQELDVNPASATAWSLLGDAYARQLRWADAKSALQRSLWINPWFSGPYVLLGNVHLKTQQPALAEAMLRKATAFDPNNRTAHYLLAQALQALGRAEEAKAEFQAAEKLPAPQER